MTSHIPQSSFRGDIGEPPIMPEVQDAIRSLQRGATRPLVPTAANNRQSPCSCSCKLTATSVGGGTPLVTVWLMPIRMDSGHNIHSTPTATCSEQRQPLYVAFIDLTRAFDTADRQALWSILSRHCYHEKYMRILRLVHAGMSVPRCSALDLWPFTVKTGLKQ